MQKSKKSLGLSARGVSRVASSIGLACLTGMAMPAMAGKKLEIDDTRWVSIGAGLRTSFTSTEDASPNGKSRSTDFEVDSIRIYMAGQAHENIKFTLNTEKIDDQVEVLDAIAQFEFSPEFNIWMGRMLTPADRIEMNGPYYGLSWNQYTQPLYPSDQNPVTRDAGALGRDEGVTVWGTKNKFQYAIGVFDGVNGFGNQDDDLLYAGRFAYNFLNMEDNPAYYTSSTYHGGLGNIFTLGVSFQQQKGGTGSDAESGDFSGYTVDLLSETVVSGGGVLTIEAEYKEFDADYTVATAPADLGTSGCFCLFDGGSSFLTVGYMFPAEFGVGKIQPYVRIVENSPSDGDSSDLTEFGINYIISGHNARLNVNFSSGDATISGYKAADDVDTISFGAQVQI